MIGISYHKVIMIVQLLKIINNELRTEHTLLSQVIYILFFVFVTCAWAQLFGLNTETSDQQVHEYTSLYIESLAFIA